MVYPAAVTPFGPDGKVDHVSMVRLVAHLESQGCDGVLLAGTNGEGPSLSAVEKRDLVRAVVPVAGSLKVVVGVATPSLEEAVWLCQQSEKAGAEAALVMPPAFFREVKEEAIALWFESLMDRTTLPIMAYNFPQRTGIPLTGSLIRRLAERPTFLGLKDSSGDRSNLPVYAEAAPGKRLVVGDESLLVEALGLGWVGTFTGAANVVAPWLVAIVREYASQRESCETKNELIMPEIQKLRTLSQPAAYKQILCRMGIIEHANVRLPLRSPDAGVVDETWDEIRKRIG